MKKYEPSALTAVSRYRNYLPTLPTGIRGKVHARMAELIREEE